MVQRFRGGAKLRDGRLEKALIGKPQQNLAHIETEASMKITIVPFSTVRAFVDTDDGGIYIGARELQSKTLSDLIQHEFGHSLSGDPDHGDGWAEVSGMDKPVTDLFKSCRKRLGIGPSIAANIGNISGIQNILTDYHLLQAYRRFSQKILGTEGHWDVVGEVDGGPGDQLIRLYPTPKGAFPVVVVYYPVVNHFRSPQARHVAYDMLLAEAKIMVGQVRRKIAGIPTPDGGSLGLDGEALISEGTEERNGLIEKAIHLGEPLPIVKWLWWLPLLPLVSLLSNFMA